MKHLPTLTFIITLGCFTVLASYSAGRELAQWHPQEGYSEADRREMRELLDKLRKPPLKQTSRATAIMDVWGLTAEDAVKPNDIFNATKVK